MPRSYNLADIFDALNTGVVTALTPDTTTAIGQTLINLITNYVETPTTSDTTTGPTAVVLSSTSNQWDVGNWGALLWG